ncbi:DMT family transporter [Rhodobacteraceae bacterium D3-12]|nr:DMT family transporter [Rhodobacteraceae bacterium D3-12]
MTDQTKGLLFTLMGVLFVVPDSLFVRLIAADALVIAFWRGAISGGAILVWLVLTRGFEPFRALLGTGFYGLFYSLITGAAGIFFVSAVSLTSVANVVLILASMPVFAAIYSWLFLGERVSRRMVRTMIAVAIGIAVIAYGSGETEGAHWSGDLIALSLSALFAAGLTAARRVRHVSMVPGAALGYVFWSLVLLAFVAPMQVPEGQWGLVALHGLLISVSGIGLALGPRYIPSAEVGLLILLESVLAPLLVWAMVGEAPGGYALVGGAIVIGALAVYNLSALRRG